MGHRRVVKFGDKFYLKTKEIETFTNTCSTGSLSNLSFSTTRSHVVGDKITTSEEVNIAYSSISEVALTFANVLEVGNEECFTIQLNVGNLGEYWEEELNTVSVNYTLNLNNLLSGKTGF